jgi:DNA repair protein RadC
MTQSILEIAKLLGISVHDHIIVGKDGHLDCAARTGPPRAGPVCFLH